MVNKSCYLLHRYIQDEQYKGYDPYDTLLSPIPFKKFGNMASALATQFQKYNPINVRRLIGVKKDYNPKGLGLMLKAYCLLHKHDADQFPLQYADELFDLILDNKSDQYQLPSWGYNFDWATPKEYLVANSPSSVVTSFVIDGVWEYYSLTGSEAAKNLILGAADWIDQVITITELEGGISYAYTAQSKGACYNASLLACEVLAKADAITKSFKHSENINKAIDFVLSKQKDKGEWWYSYNIEADSERKQIDFHQGFILISLNNLNKLLPIKRQDVDDAIKKGLRYYKNYQFYSNGKSLWRIPKAWPVDIHNQSQGIITFNELAHYDDSYYGFAKTIAQWTIENMQDKKGYFYYRIFKHHKHKIPYMRWSQAWMLLAFATFITTENTEGTED